MVGEGHASAVFDCNVSHLGLALNLSASCLAPDRLGALEQLSSFSTVSDSASRGLTALSWLLVFPWILAVTVALISIISRTLPHVVFARKARRLSSSAWVIHGKKYDLSSWARSHPGGEMAIELGRNRDCTGLFESYHVFADRAKLDKILARYEIPNEAAPDVRADTPSGDAAAVNTTGLEFDDAFHKDVKAMLKSHFNGESHKMKTWVGFLMVALVCLEIHQAYLFLHGSTAAIVLLPTIGWLLCCNLAHDGSHFAISKRPWVNTLASYASLPLFFPPTCWHLQHVVQHHIYTNDEDDVDLYHFLPVCRTSKFTKWASQHSLQWLGIFFVLPTAVGHLLIIVPIDLLSRQLDALTGKRRYYQCQNLEDFVARFSGKILVEFLMSASFVVLLLYMQGFNEGLRRLFLSYSIASFWFIAVTQGAHLRRECMVGKEGEYQSWAKRQAATSVNYRPDSIFWLIWTGALNVQSLHHVVPCVGSSHLIDLYPKYKQVCAKHGVELKEASSLTEVFWGFIGWIRELAQDEEVEPPPAAVPHLAPSMPTHS
mmetsp:Transcript_132254/g.411085  ORF Transcript_132254/g.411085 Transcript_132254/m.411085 type:complete len:544 (-) Transcript_132254:283-1914(-)|eukprot:CAMPEP_0204523874 /NCGR_PEP_ID=MMETSP0661-20131031/7071_1 /ASSEMBLY_ACC=CAM_ASM_000606 /TAXON_ID=109239 /ORGANISM="Alexandrium margalefi, Strain AMGDE01CS-322" /LENGTH=543 /DNA_ID=CAMNT_0051529599 /DNA_START=129 /DNA_END=1760 /DNA_ORIENTATION=+